MGRPPKRTLRAAVASTTTPPDRLPDGQAVARVVKAEGSNLYSCALPDDESDDGNNNDNNNKLLLVELDPKFCNAVWLRRGGYVLVHLVASSSDERSRPAGSRVAGDIVNVVRDEKAWRKMPYWPKEFAKSPTGCEDEDNDQEEQSTVGEMPPSASEGEEEAEASQQTNQT